MLDTRNTRTRGMINLMMKPMSFPILSAGMNFFSVRVPQLRDAE